MKHCLYLFLDMDDTIILFGFDCSFHFMLPIRLIYLDELKPISL